MKRFILTALLALFIPASAAHTAATPKKASVPDGGGEPTSGNTTAKKMPAVPHTPRNPARSSAGVIRGNTTPFDKNAATVSPISLFPYQDPFSESPSFEESFPVTLDNGDLLVVWASAYRDSLYSARSTDGGMSWSPPSFVSLVFYYCSDLCGIRTSGGRIIAVWQNSYTGLSSCYSTDDGVSWSAPGSVTSVFGEHYTTLTQSLDGTLWLTYSRRNVSTGYDIFYRTSSDSGVTWSGEATFMVSSANEYYASVVSKDSTTLLAIFESNSSGAYDFYSKASTNAGVTWSSPVLVADSLTDEMRPRVLRQSDGTLWLIGQHYSPSTDGYTQSDIYYTKSTDGGISWASPSGFTKYAGYDGWFNACLRNNVPFVTFASHRWNEYLYNSRIWQGFLGVSVEGDTPPALITARWTTPWQNRPISILAYAADDIAVSDVRLSYHLNGAPYGPVQMYDDGLHNDSLAGDNIWGVAIGPLQLGDGGDFSIDITDGSLNEVDVYVSSFAVPAIHDTGNVILRIGDNSELADNGISLGACAYWPKIAGYDYLYDGGLWVGCTVGESNLAMQQMYGLSDWHRTGGTAFTLAPGLSDQDCEVTYDDQFTTRTPIGLRVRQQSYQWSAPGRDDFIILRYTVTNRSEVTLSNIFLSLWLDIDVAEQTDCTKNSGGFNSDRQLLYMYNTTNDPTGYVGVRMLSSIHTPYTVSLLSAVYDPPFGDDDAVYQIITRGGMNLPAVPYDDYRALLTAPPFSLAPGDSSTVAFGIVLGDGLAGLQTNTDSMEAVYMATFPTGTVDPVYASSRASVQFGNISVAATKIDSICIKNIGWNPMNIDSVITMTRDFSVTPTLGRVVNRSDSVTYIITFSPVSAGSKKDTLRLFTNAAGSPHQIPLSGSAFVTGLENRERNVPADYAIRQNYPNPFNPETVIEFELPEASAIKILITDVLGRRVAMLVDEALPAGYHSVRWNGLNASGQKVASGVYFCTMTVDGSSGKRLVRTLKMALTK